jgi:citrate lyase subunit beta/citryl-CoA lyase/(S)-citramalyl-CoA lyase
VLVNAAASADIELIDVPFVDIQNEAGLVEETYREKALGFTGKAAIHPKQIASIHGAFNPTQDQIDYAKAVLAAVDGPDAGVVVVDGKMVDRPIILACQRVMALAAQN